ncbi:MAG: hypothetical protein ACKV22_23835 [Bryobacteraceae bacterium]
MITKHDIESGLFVLTLVFVFGSLFTTVTATSRHTQVYQGLFITLAILAFAAMGLVGSR